MWITFRGRIIKDILTLYPKLNTMVNEVLLEQAIDRYNSKNTITDNHYKDDMNSFILRIYLQCDPAGYGKVFVKKILRDHNSLNEHGINIYPMLDRSNIGDVVLTYPKEEYFTSKFYDPRCKYAKEINFMKDVSKRFFEVKISYLGKNDTYTVRNIRPYQNFEYYILCFVNCAKNFKPTFLVVDKSVITDGSIFTLTPMNGTKKSNKDNTDIGYGLSFKRDHWKDLYLESKNLMDGTTYEDLTRFFSEMTPTLKKEFEKNVKISPKDRKEKKKYKIS
jgi:hypothetical protein